MSKVVTIISVSENRTDKNGRIYQAVKVEAPSKREMVDEETGEIFYAIGRPKRATIVAYKMSYLDDAPHYLFDKEPGIRVYGTIVTRKVMPYEIEGDGDTITVDRYTTFVEATTDDEDFEDRVISAFKSAGHELMFKKIDPIVPAPQEEAAKEEPEAETEEAPEQFSVVGEEDDDDNFENEF